MTVNKLQGYLDGLLAADRRFDADVVAIFKKISQDWFGVSKAEWRFLEDKVLGEHGDRFVDEASRQELARFLVQQVKSGRSFWDPILRFLSAIPGLGNILVEISLAQWEQIFKDGKAPPDVIQEERQKAINFRGIASLVKIDPRTEEVAEIEAAIKKAIDAIDGFAFLSRPPEGKGGNEHTILMKVGVNWGYFLYPTVTSWQTVYAIARMCLQEAATRGAAVEVIVGDETGIENAFWGGTTMGNFQHTGILQAAVLAGLEHAASREAAEPEKFAGARELLEVAHAGHKVTLDPEDGISLRMVELARRAGVRVVGFEELEHLQLPVPNARHFPEGILVPRFVADEVTDIINLPKPPGRHMIMGNTGLTGALKNHVGLLPASNRSPALHGPYDRLPPPAPGQTGDSYLENLQAQGKGLVADRSGQAARKFAQDVVSNWQNLAPGLPFHAKLVELYLAVADKERFSVADMRRTVSSIGPDLGDTIDIGAVIAAKDPLTLDVLAGALLKRAYVGIGSAFDALKPGGDTLLEYLVGKTWLENGTPFDLMSHIAANSYGVGPIDFAHIDLKDVGNSGFSPAEIEAITSYLR
jgi:hypothetical protein